MRVTNFEEVCYGYDLQEAQLEASRCLDCKKPRCVEHCPVSLQIPKFIEQVVKGDFAEAARIIGQDSSLPSVCGRVCPQESQCEGSCILGIKGEPVAIGKLERFVGDWSIANGGEAVATAAPNGKKVAVVGSGRPVWPALPTWLKWDTASRFSKRCIRLAACFNTEFPNSACRKKRSWPKRLRTY